MEKTPLAVRLGEFVAALRFDDLPPAVIGAASPTPSRWPRASREA